MGYPTKTSAIETFYCGGGGAPLIHNFNLVDETKINYLVIPPPMQHHNVLRDIPPLLFINRQHLSNFQANDSQQSKMTVFLTFFLGNSQIHFDITLSGLVLKSQKWHQILGWTTSSPHFMSSSPLPPFQTASDGFCYLQ